MLAVTLVTGQVEYGGSDLGSGVYWAIASALSLVGVLGLVGYLRSAEASAVLTAADAAAKVPWATTPELAERPRRESLEISKSDEQVLDSITRISVATAGYDPVSASAAVMGGPAWQRVLPAVWPSVAAAFLSFTQGLLVVCLLPYVPSQSGDDGLNSHALAGGQSLAQQLVFVNLFANLAGRLLSLAPGPGRVLAGSPTARLLLSIPFLWYVFGATAGSWRSDGLALGYVGVMVVTAGYVSSVVYSSACEAVPLADQPTATLLVNIGMSLGMWSGIGFGWLLAGTMAAATAAAAGSS